ncbi:MAG: hypothetical protein K2J20_02625 [Bacilli bacterium]|nr:hypothetical protein [Bacilli bacterium]
MKFHAEILIFELLKLSKDVTDNNHLPLGELEEAFYSAQDIINSEAECSCCYVFSDELTKLLEKYSEYFEFKDNNLHLTYDVESTFNMFLGELNTLTETDFYIPRYIQNVVVYHSLKLPMPHSDIKPYFQANEELLQTYKEIAQKEFSGLPFDSEIAQIKKIMTFLDESLAQEDETLYTKLKVCLEYLNYNFSVPMNDIFANTAWNIILFDPPKPLQQQLQYKQIEVLLAIMDQINHERLDVLINEYLYEDEEAPSIEDFENPNPTLGEIPAFLTYFIIYLTKYLQKHPDSPAKKNLTIKKYLLLSTTELGHVEDYFIEHLTIEDFELPNLPSYSSNAFELIKPNVLKCIGSLNYPDTDISNNPSYLSQIIINAIFIRCFLDLSINEQSKNTVETLIKIRFAGNPNYQITNNIIDEIIFNSPPNPNRHN